MSSEQVYARGRHSNVSTLFVDCGHDADSDYAKATGIDISSNADYTPSKPMHGLVLTCVVAGGAAAAGNIDVTLLGGGRMVLPYSVLSGESEVFLRGCVIATVHGDTTSTFTGGVFPLW